MLSRRSDRRRTRHHPGRTRGLTRCRLGAPTQTRSDTTLIDRIRHDIQHRLDQLLAEADKLRHALAALDPRERSPRAVRSANSTRSQPTASRAAKTADTAQPTRARARTRAAGAGN